MKGPAGSRRMVAVVIAVLLVGAGAVALRETAPARAASEIRVAATGSFSVSAVSGFSFTPNSFEMLPTGATITVTFTDVDTIPHTFSILDRQGVVIPPGTATTPAGLSSLFSTYGSLFTHNLTGNGDQYIGTFSAPSSAGWYEFVCLEPGHFQDGMYGFLAFGENLPANLTVAAPNTNPGLAVFIIVGAIVALVVIALVLGFVYGRRRGAAEEMPPERLGYPEPEGPGAPAPPPESPPLSDEPRG